MAGRRSLPLMTVSVVEAADLLGVGRTKAYDMTREWRATEGASGLPVIDCGNTLRVPLHPLAAMLGVEVSHLLAVVRDVPADEAAPEPPPTALLEPVPTATSKVTRNRRKPAIPANQLDLFEHPTAS
ncbi:MAG: hypothetical protein ACRDQW_18045 [Haloechinothrix sp.]